MTQIKSFTEKYRNWILIIIAIIVVLLLMSSGGIGYKYIKNQKKLLNDEITQLQDQNKTLLDSVSYYKNIDNELIAVEKSYYDDYVKEYSKRIKAEKALLNIRHLIFDREYLDSLTEHIKYR
jgi:ABC-type bacteriocin/lantibiotic exporter with double-glycine peptidase domain